MNLVKRALISSAGAAMAVGLMAGTASAATAFPPPFGGVTATTHVNTLAAGNDGFWAGVSVTRTATVSGGAPVPAFFCGPAALTCFRYRAALRDSGVFRTFPHALTPNQFWPGRHIRGIVSGRVTGSASFTTFYASTQPSALNVPLFISGLAGAPGTWPQRFFPPGTSFRGLFMSPWTFTFSAWTFCGRQTWIDASWNGHGNLPFDGNIRGCF